MKTKSNTISDMEVIDAWLWGVEPDNYDALETELKNRGYDTAQIASDVADVEHTHMKFAAMRNGERTITAKYGGICPKCNKQFNEGDPIVFNPDAPRGKRAAHVKCGEPESVPAPVTTQAEVDPVKIQKMIDAAVKAASAEIIKTKRIEVVQIADIKIEVKQEHKMFPVILALVANRQNVWLVGPAGSGKTTAVEHVAGSLELDFAATSVGPQTSQFEFFGYMDANGKLVRSMFRDTYEKGGVFLVDEIDAGNPQILTKLNAALSSGVCAFPDKMVKKHKDFVCIAAANTFGLGANRVYCGRNQIDGATLDRFAFVEFGYDEELETALAGGKSPWVSYVQAVRKFCDENGIRHIVSPRASINGAKLLKAGMARPDVERMILWKGLPQDQIDKVKAGVGETEDEV